MKEQHLGISAFMHNRSEGLKKGKRIVQVACTIVLAVVLSLPVIGQQKHAFQEEIDAFKVSDSISMPARKQILFTGSSSFRLWKDVQDYFPGYPIINRGVGGSTLDDIYYYRHELIDPYHPRQVIIYCGENDFASSDTISAATVVERFTKLHAYIRSVYPKVPVVFVSIKPSPSRRKYFAKMVEANAAIEHFCRKQKNTEFVNIYDAMLLPDGNPIPAIFTADSLHMNDAGYRIWQQKLLPALRH